jgi:hypothetical protein
MFSWARNQMKTFVSMINHYLMDKNDKSKMAAIKNLYFHEIWAFLVTQSPCNRGILHEWYHFAQGTPRNNISDVTIKTGTHYMFPPFFKMAAIKELTINRNQHRIMVLVT